MKQILKRLMVIGVNIKSAPKTIQVEVSTVSYLKKPEVLFSGNHPK